MTPSGSIALSGSFPTGTKVGLYCRYGDHFHPGGEVVKSATVGKDGTVEFKGLEPGAQFFVAAEVGGGWQTVNVIAKAPAPAAPQKPSPEEVRERLAQTRPVVDQPIHEGVRTSIQAKPRKARSGRSRPKAVKRTAKPRATSQKRSPRSKK